MAQNTTNTKIKIPVYDNTGKKTQDVEVVALSTIREDIFKKATLIENTWSRQGHGADPQAGKKQVINLSKRRRKLRTTYGKGMSRSPRKVMWSRGTQFSYKGAFAAFTVGGRKAHAPTAEKNVLRGINNKEWQKALENGFAASLNVEQISKLGQRVSSKYPFMLDDKCEEAVMKTKDAKSMLESLDLANEIERTSEVKIRAGKGTMRNRRYKVKRGPLFVVSSSQAPLFKALRNIKGFDVITPELLLAQDFGMSEKPGRQVIFTKSAYEIFAEVLN